jgi:hypothetical protein
LRLGPLRIKTLELMALSFPYADRPLLAGP